MVGNRKLEEEQLPYDTEPALDAGIDLVAVFAAVLTEWKAGLAAFVVVAACGLAYVHSLKPQYVATATFLPSEGHTEAANLASILNATGPGSLYVGLMHSRSVQDDVINHAHLLQLFGTQSYEIARAVLGGKSSFAQGGDSIITIAVRDENAQNAAGIANAYLIGLQDLSDKMAQAQASQSRRFFDRQLQEQRDQLTQAEQELLRLQERTGQVAPESQAATSISNIANLRSQIQGLQVQLAVLRQSEAEGNPDVERLRLQIAQLQGQERVQEASKAATPIGAAVAAADIPTLNLQIGHAQEVVAARRAAVNSMGAQFGSARMDSQLSHPVFQVIDRAIAPELRSWPPRNQYDAAALGFALIMALVAVLGVLVARRILRNPEHRASLHRLRRAF